MNDLVFYDAAVPPPTAPKTDGVAFYIGGDAAHVWTLDEINATTARYRLPIFVRSDPTAASPVIDTVNALAALDKIGAPKGCLVSWDTETAADPHYMATVYGLIASAGYQLMDYGSQDSLFGNHLSVGGYYWGADWTGNADVLQGDAGTQYANDGQYDLSVFKPGLPFWDTHPTTSTNWQEKMMQQLPTIHISMTGPAVRTAQALCVARGYTTVAVDGDFGPLTDHVIQQIQTAAKITADGIVGPQTWPVLLGV